MKKSSKLNGSRLTSISFCSVFFSRLTETFLFEFMSSLCKSTVHLKCVNTVFEARQAPKGPLIFLAMCVILKFSFHLTLPLSIFCCFALKIGHCGAQSNFCFRLQSPLASMFNNEKISEILKHYC